MVDKEGIRRIGFYCLISTIGDQRPEGGMNSILYLAEMVSTHFAVKIQGIAI